MSNYVIQCSRCGRWRMIISENIKTHTFKCLHDGCGLTTKLASRKGLRMNKKQVGSLNEATALVQELNYAFHAQQ